MLHELRILFPGCPFIAVTATATAVVRRNIKEGLALRVPLVLQVMVVFVMRTSRFPGRWHNVTLVQGLAWMFGPPRPLTGA